MEQKSFLICACAKIVSEGIELFLGGFGDKSELVQFLFVVHQILLKSGVWAVWMCREHA